MTFSQGEARISTPIDFGEARTRIDGGRSPMLYIRSYCKYSNGKLYETGNVRCPDIKVAESDALRRIEAYGAVAVVISKPDGTLPWGSHKRRDILRFELQNDRIKRIPLV